LGLGGANYSKMKRLFLVIFLLLSVNVYSQSDYSKCQRLTVNDLFLIQVLDVYHAEEYLQTKSYKLKSTSGKTVSFENNSADFNISYTVNIALQDDENHIRAVTILSNSSSIFEQEVEFYKTSIENAGFIFDKSEIDDNRLLYYYRKNNWIILFTKIPKYSQIVSTQITVTLYLLK
jgi:hypothetical protein